MAVTLDDVARVCGVSRATASRALSGSSHVRQSTRLRVESAADSLGYRANHSARALAKGRTNVVGFILPTEAPLADPFLSMLVTSVAEAANNRGMGLMLWLSGLEASSDGVNQAADATVVDGVVVVGTAFGTPDVDGLLDLSLIHI